MGFPQINPNLILGIGDSIAGGINDWRTTNNLQDAVKQATGPDGTVDYGKLTASLLSMGDVKSAASIAAIANRNNNLDVLRFEETMRHNRETEKNQAAGAGGRPYVTTAPDEYGVNQPVWADRQTQTITPVSPNKRYRPMTEGGVKQLTDEGQKFAGLRDFTNTFQDSYAGMHLGPIDYGNTAKSVGQLGIGTENASQAAQWWQGYDRYKNTVRKELYGVALTPSEQGEFEKADIRPGQDPSIVRHNLEIQKTILERAMKKRADALTKSGFNPDVINSAYGLDASTLKDNPIPSPQGPAQATPQEGENPNIPGVIYSPEGNARPIPAPDKLQMLRRFANNPEAIKAFDEIYGPGAADHFLQGGQ